MVMFFMVLFLYFLVIGGKVFEYVSISVCCCVGRYVLVRYSYFLKFGLKGVYYIMWLFI